MNLRTMPCAKLAVLQGPDGELAGWAGMDAETHPERPEVFSQFVYPAYRGLGLGALLEHVWWAYLSAWGCHTAYMRMELDSNETLFRHRLASGYCREVSERELGSRFVSACRRCELFGKHCRRQVYLAVDVDKALRDSVRRRSRLDIRRLPIHFSIAGSRGRQSSQTPRVSET
ncbi:MAG: GNAT family N-acetyltransferase [Gammaproteobacteria bacterium]